MVGLGQQESLGGCTDGKLKKVMAMLAGHVDECLTALGAENQVRAVSRQPPGLSDSDMDKGPCTFDFGRYGAFVHVR